MAEFLVIRLDDKPGQSAEWIAVDDNGTRRSSPVAGPLADAVKDVGETGEPRRRSCARQAGARRTPERHRPAGYCCPRTPG